MSAALVRALKESSLPERFRLAVGEYALVPIVCSRERLDAREVRNLTVWRNRNVRAFLHEFEASEARTASWLAEKVANDDTRILFALVDREGTMVGYLGLAYIDWQARYGEADAIVRGVDLPPGTMKRALTSLLVWAQEGLGLKELGVRVLSDNPACRFYERCGFVEYAREALEQRTVEDGTIWEPAPIPNPKRSLVHYRYAAH